MGIPPQIELGVLGWADSLILMVLALVVFGPRRLPQIGRQIGKLMYEFRKASNDFKFQMEEEMRASEEADRRKKQEEERLRAEAIKAAESPALPAASESGGVYSPGSPYSPGRPYSEDAVYPPGARASEPEPASEPAVESQTPPSYPEIHTPSTGEPVAAAHPFKASPEAAEHSETSGLLPFPANGANPQGSVVAEHGAVVAHGGDVEPVTEQADHHD